MGFPAELNYRAKLQQAGILLDQHVWHTVHKVQKALAYMRI